MLNEACLYNFYRISIPKSAQGLSQSNLALSIDSRVASLRPYFETLNTMLYILEDTTENRAEIVAYTSITTDELLISALGYSVSESTC